MTDFRIRKNYRRYDKDDIDFFFTIEEFKLVWVFFLGFIPYKREHQWRTMQETNCGYDSCYDSDRTFNTEEKAKEWLEKECRARKLIIPKSEIVQTYKCIGG